jgi:hypothetical protein
MDERMNPSTRRYLPGIGVVALLLVAVYFGQPDRMTGSAAGAGCAGGQGQLVAENEAGAVTQAAYDSVRAVVKFNADAEEAGEMASLEDLKATVEDMGAAAVPALLEELRDTGCMTTNSAELVDLIQILGDQPDFDGELYGVIADTLLDVAVVSLDDASGDDGAEMTAELANAGESDEPAVQAVLDDAGNDGTTMQAADAANKGDRTFECAIDALDVVREWSAAKTDADETLKKVLEQIAEAAPGSKSVVELVELLSELAPQDAEWADTFEGMAVDQEMDKDARGLACDAAVERESKLQVMRDDLSAVTSPAAAVCLIEESPSFEDASYAHWGIKSDESSVRLASITTFIEVGGDQDIERLLVHLFTAPQDEPRDFDDSERAMTVKAITALVEESEVEGFDLLASAADLAEVSESGAAWLEELDAALPNWEPSSKE